MNFSEKQANMIMTQLDDIFMISITATLGKPAETKPTPTPAALALITHPEPSP